MSSAQGSLTTLALQKFKKNFWGVFSLTIVVLCGLIAVFAYALAPDNSENANQMHLSIHSKKPGFSVQMLTLPTQKPVEESFLKTAFFGKQNGSTEIPINTYRFTKDSLYYTEYNPEATQALEKATALQTTFSTTNTKNIEETYIKQQTFLLGTDKYGRDLLSRLLIGTRISFSIGFVAVFISLLVGVSLGSIAGYFGGKVDAFIMWLINVTWSIPTLLLVIGITLALGKGFWQVFIAVGLTMWVEVARVVRGQMVSAKQMQYITAAKALGYGHARIITKHILPNILAPVIVISAANFAAAILVESGLSFLGIGAQPPIPSWGAMIKDHYNYIILGKAYLALIPGIAIMTLVMAFMLVGNALRDAFDVKN
ncbi:ABC transporter permease [Neptunitalea lumnitzerae]|uniref:Peptide ABC transporter permease n=1 Tax=Neptunitalea lumnitzerae TaxID=2965509 RepID=A0ABQ5MGZ6_9FLAO|nr:ABC transporter permease [Neptunitalea sp. Y10]GLB48696.1 peptide ABC transporter permease [Neptunitalea sp. Y10]